MGVQPLAHPADSYTAESHSEPGRHRVDNRRPRSATPNITLGILSEWFAKISILGLTSVRYWFGISDVGLTHAQNGLFSDTPAYNFEASASPMMPTATIMADLSDRVGESDARQYRDRAGSREVYVPDIVPGERMARVSRSISTGRWSRPSTQTCQRTMCLMGTLFSPQMVTICSGGTNNEFGFYYCYALLNS